ncbi:MAG: outer membrane beta-barrel protein [Alphaproteobacteria bacterium]
MKLFIGVLVLMFVGVFNANAQQVSSLYGELAYSRISLDEIDFDAIGARGGLNFTDNLAVEAEAFTGVNSETVRVGGVNVKTDLSYQLGAYLALRTLVSTQTELFARIGIARAEIEASAMGVTVDGAKNTAAGGLGLRHEFNDRVTGIRADATYLNFDGGDGWAYGVSIFRRF